MLRTELLLSGPVAAVVVLVESFNASVRSKEAESNAVSRACSSAAMRWAKGTSSMSRKSRAEEATLGSEGLGSLGPGVVAIV